MRRRLILGILAGLVVSSILASVVSVDAQGQITVRIAGHPNTANQTAEFTLVNDTGDRLTYTTYDGGTLHNGLERLEAGNWTNVDLGYCGLGMDGEVAVAPGRHGRVTAYVGGTPGTYRIRVYLQRMTANGTSAEQVLSDPFQVP